MLVVGVAGAISSGKSTVSRLLEKKGATVVSADRIGHALLEKGGAVYRKVVERFGDGVLDEEGRIDREKLGREVFRTPDALEDLDKIVHPPLIEVLRNTIVEMRLGESGIGVVDAALIPEWGLEDEFDVYVYVDAPREKRAAWYTEKTGKTSEDFELRDRAQWPPEKKSAGADIRIENDRGEEDLFAKVEDLWKVLQKMERSKE
jgi:dephospho-CoA kinase